MNVQRIRVIVFVLLILGSITAIALLPENLSYLLIKEWGPLENIQVIFYITGSFVSWIYARRRIWTGGYEGSVVLLIFAMRELDFQKMFTGISITRTKYYFHSDATLSAKLLCAVIVLSIIVFFILFIKKNIRGFIHNVKTREYWALSVMAGLFCMLFAMIVDSGKRVLESLLSVSMNDGHVMIAIEELFELAIPYFFLNALLLYGNQSATISKKNVIGSCYAIERDVNLEGSVCHTEDS